jgi:23S rRNA (cytosine1962-C5)-methyltransferase
LKEEVIVLDIRYPTASLKPHRNESLQSGHLWIFSGALQQTPRWVEPGGLIDVKSATGQFVARGYYNPATDIAIRILTHDPNELIDDEFLRHRIRRAQELRAALDQSQTNAYRLINAEGDGLPGLVVDRYADILVVQIHTLGMEKLRPQLVEALLEVTGATGILWRNDVQGRKREGLELEEPAVAAGEVPALIPILENGIQFEVDPWGGQKTGFFLDQRDKRNALRRYTHNKRVLNCFSYTGGFSVYAALSDSETRVVSVDSSEPAVETAYQHFQLNGLDPELHQFLIADAFDYMEQAVEQGEQFDVIVLDPPAFAKSQSARAQAIKGYRRLNMLGIQLLRPGGILLSCSCSGHIEMDDLLSVISQSAQHFKREVQLLEMYNLSIDHPMHLSMPETSYLKTVFCRVN